LILCDFCCSIAIVVSCCLIMACHILIVVPGCCIVLWCGLSCSYRSLLLSYWPCLYGSPLLSHCSSCHGIVVCCIVFLMLVLLVFLTEKRDTETICSWPRQQES
jgi:hypothetical protein